MCKYLHIYLLIHVNISKCRPKASYIEYIMRVTRELLTIFFHTKLCFVELQNKPKFQIKLNFNLWFQSNMNTFIITIRYVIDLFFLLGNYDGNFHKKITFVIFLSHFFCKLITWLIFFILIRKWLYRTYSLKKYRQVISVKECHFSKAMLLFARENDIWE